jgi:succinate-semialdehyde dehydrogenase/glutarate-semialdehyde dehydrogenase
MEVNLSADIIDYYADNGEAFLADKNLNPESGGKLSRNSNWVLFGVMPWNFPFLSRSYGFAANIMVGTPYY